MQFSGSDLLFRKKMACAYFFAAPALAYGIFSARLPALRELLKADESRMGILLLCIGGATLFSLLCSGWLVDRFGGKRSVICGTLLFSAAMLGLSFGCAFQVTALGCVCAGLGVGLCDVAMNALGMELECRHNILCMSFLHAGSSIGGVAGSLLGALFISFGLAPWINFAVVLGLFLLFMPKAAAGLDSRAAERAPKKETFFSLSFFLLICGFLGLLAHIVEGTVGEWGSIYLNSVKGSSQREAALAFAAFTGAMVVCRLAGDRLRLILGDPALVCGGSFLAAFGMVLVLLASQPWLCLLGFAVMGLGVAPIVPILFSRAGVCSGFSAGRASAVVSTFSYAGLLLLPPFIGFIARLSSLTGALWLIVGCCVAMVIGSGFLIKPAEQKN